MLLIDDSGMPKAPTIRQLMNKDIKALYTRDTTPDKKNYIADCIVIYYLGDPKSPAKQAGLSDAECLKEAIKQAGLPTSYIPDKLVIKLIKDYYNENITEAGLVVENLNQTIHNMNLSINAMNSIINEKLNTGITIDDMSTLLDLQGRIKSIAGDIPSILKKLEEAKQNLMYEKETEQARGGNIVMSSMDAENY